jgi:ribosomal protein S18 acetylase RimI-like enzyme
MAEHPLPRRITGRTYTEYLVRRTTKREELRALLEPRRSYAAYGLGQLQPRLFARSAWWTARGAGGEAVLAHSSGGLGNALFALGTVDALESILRLHPGPRFTFLTCELHHLEVIRKHYEIPNRDPVLRMLVTRDSFVDIGGSAERLNGRDVREINRLYRADGTPAFYTAQNIDDAVYYGALANGRLVAVAGTHVISYPDSIAVAGNVFVHPKYRGQGLSHVVTGAVTRELLRGCRDVVLSVDPENTPAVRAYKRLGYREVGRLIEGAATRRDIGLLAFLRRRTGAIAGRRYGAELVRIRG